MGLEAEPRRRILAEHLARPDVTSQNAARRKSRSFGDGRHGFVDPGIKPERFQKASSTSRFIRRLLVM